MTTQIGTGGHAPESLRRDTAGATIVEYAFVAAVAALIAMAGVRHFGNALGNVMQFDLAELASADDSSGGGAPGTDGSGEDDDSSGQGDD